MSFDSIIDTKRHDVLRILLIFLILILTLCNTIFALFKRSDIIKARLVCFS